MELWKRLEDWLRKVVVQLVELGLVVSIGVEIGTVVVVSRRMGHSVVAVPVSGALFAVVVVEEQRRIGSVMQQIVVVVAAAVVVGVQLAFEWRKDRQLMVQGDVGVGMVRIEPVVVAAAAVVVVVERSGVER